MDQLLWLLILLLLPIAFWTISCFFLCFPNILHKRMKFKYQPFNHLVEGDQIYCIGHRGGGFEGPQNTLQLFQKTDSTSDMIQTDLRFTKDQILVVHHDQTLERTCNDIRSISQLNFNQLPRLAPRIQSFGGEMIQTKLNRIISLQELFQKFPEKPMNIDLKYASTQSINQFDRLVRKFNRQEITIWGIAGSMNEQLRLKNAQVINFYSGGEVLKVFFLFAFGLLPFVCLRQGVLDIPLATNSFYRVVSNFLRDSSCIIRFLFCLVFYGLKIFNFTSHFWIPHLKKRGILTFYWIINQEEDFDSAISMGCSGIMTDQTLKLKRYLSKRNLSFDHSI